MIFSENRFAPIGSPNRPASGQGLRDLRVLLRFGEDEAALQHALYEIADARRFPRRVGRVKLLRRGKIAGQHRDVVGQHAVAGRAQRRVRCVNFLHRRADQAGVLRNLAAQHGDAQIDVAEDSVARIVLRLIGRRAEQHLSHRLELLDRGDAELFLAVEVMKEAALGKPCGLADIVDAGGRIALGANDIGCGGQKLAAGLRAVRVLTIAEYRTDQLVYYCPSRRLLSSEMSRGCGAGTGRSASAMIPLSRCIAVALPRVR